jgi:adenosylhomocysteine nucleosidase
MLVITSAMTQETDQVLACLAGTADAAGTCPAWRGECAGGPVTAVCTGVGREAVLAGLGGALAEEGVTAVISTGFAGGLTADLKTGDIVISEVTLAEGVDGRYAADDSLFLRAERARSRNGPRVVRGTAVTIPEVAGDMAAKRALRERTGADICEMEDYWAARLAAERGLPFLSVRVIIDELTTDVRDYSALVDLQETGLARAAGFFLARPRRLALAFRAWRQLRTARASLRYFLRRFLADRGEVR